jgi:hypothetical protein
MIAFWFLSSLRFFGFSFLVGSLAEHVANLFYWFTIKLKDRIGFDAISGFDDTGSLFDAQPILGSLGLVFIPLTGMLVVAGAALISACENNSAGAHFNGLDTNATRFALRHVLHMRPLVQYVSIGGLAFAPTSILVCTVLHSTMPSSLLRTKCCDHRCQCDCLGPPQVARHGL